MKNKLPQFIYKYTTINKFLYETLIRNELWFSSPFDFNDPYDSAIPINLVLESYKRTKGFETDEKFIKDNQEMIVKPIKFGNQLEDLRKTVGVCCFSAIEDNLIMWSHYADNHKGILLKFDVSELQKVFSKIYAVVYSDKIKEIDYESSPENLLNKLITRKSNHWRSEKEIRIITKKRGNYAFPKIALKGIRFGLKCDHHQQKDVMSIVKKFGYDHILFTAVSTTNYDYKLSTSLITVSSEYVGYRAMGDKEIDIKALMETLKKEK